MNYASGVWDQQAAFDASDASHLAAMRGMTFLGMSGLDMAEAEDEGGLEALAGDEAKVRLVGMLISQASMGSDVRFEMVAALREAIEAGTYRVAASDLAAKLMLTLRR